MTAALPLLDEPQVVFEELMEEIRDNIANRPRDLQTQLGPSEVGDPCDRSLIAKLMELPEPGRDTEPVNWRAWVGTSMHAALEDIFAHSFMQDTAYGGPRFLLETPVTVGRIGDFDLTGSCDLFDTASGSVWDWKTKSKTRHQEHRRHGMGQKYRVQFHCYGMGIANTGRKVSHVGGIFLLRDGELADTFFLAEPYDPQIALDALARAHRLYTLGTLLGAQVAMNAYPTCDEEFCRWCGNYRAPFGPPRSPQPTTIAGAVAAAKPPKGK